MNTAFSSSSFPSVLRVGSSLAACPVFQDHLSYLYSETGATDQKVGGDAIQRYSDLRKQVDAMVGDLDKVLGPVRTADNAVSISSRQVGNLRGTPCCPARYTGASLAATGKRRAIFVTPTDNRH